MINHVFYLLLLFFFYDEEPFQGRATSCIHPVR